MLIDQWNAAEDKAEELANIVRQRLKSDCKGKQREAAEDIGVSLTNFNDMLHGRRPINRELREKLKRWLKD